MLSVHQSVILLFAILIVNYSIPQNYYSTWHSLSNW